MTIESELDAEFGAGMTEAYFQMRETARDVIDLIKAGDTEEAVLRLERDFWPKWDSVNECQRELFEHQEAAPESAVAC